MARRHRRRAVLAVGAAIGTLGLAGADAAWAAQTSTLSAGFSPEHLGAPTSLSFAFTINGSGGGVPPPLRSVRIRYPPGLGLATNGLGVAYCQPLMIETRGPGACPPDSQMGAGTALLRFQVGPQVLQENASLALIAGPSREGALNILIAATGTQPVAARVVMSTLLEAGALQIEVPLVPSLPEGPDVAIVAVRATLGGNLTYYEHVHGHTQAYHPRGVGLPSRCPRGGFRFSAAFSFTDGSTSSASTTVRCPRRG